MSQEDAVNPNQPEPRLDRIIGFLVFDQQRTIQKEKKTLFQN